MGSTIRSRELTSEDWVGLDKPIFSPLLSALLAALAFYLALSLVLGAGGMVLAALGAFGADAWPGSAGAAWSPVHWLFLVVLVVLPLHVASRAYLRVYRRKRAIWLDLHERRVEVIEVENARTLVVIDERDRCFFVTDLDDGKTLLIDGERIPLEPDLLVAQFPAQENDEDVELENGWYPLRPDFPNSSFALHRLPRTGHIVQLETRGLALLPMKKLARGEIQLPAIAAMASNADCGSLVLQQRFDTLL